MAIRIGINGFGRIGRALARLLRDADDLRVAAINDTAPTPTLGHLLRHDSVAGPFPGTVEFEGDRLRIGDREVRVSHAEEPRWIPWREAEVEVVVESTGRFTGRKAAARHLEAGASRVIVSAVAPDADVTLLVGVNDSLMRPAHLVVSTASCTTHAAGVLLKVLDDRFGVLAAQMTTVHCYTGSQPTMDLPHADLRRARAAGLSMIPTTTSAARGLAAVFPHLADRLSCLAVRVPTATVSLVELVVATREDLADEDEVLAAFRAAAGGPLRGVLGVVDEPLVSIDFRGDPRSAVVDAELVATPGERMARVIAWYDNEYGYAHRLADTLRLMARRG